MLLADSSNAVPNTAAHAVGCALIIVLLPSEFHRISHDPPGGGISPHKCCAKSMPIGDPIEIK
jgi:hypothetical protein